MAPRVLVLGGSGRVGKMLRRGWAQDCMQDGTGPAFTFQTRKRTAATPDDVVWDITQPVPQTLLEAAPFDCMIVLAGVVPAPDADLTLNRTLGLASLSAAAQLGIGSVLLASSSAVYGTYLRTPFHETDATQPVNAYGAAKLEMEVACRTQAAASGIGLCCLRIGNVAGADALLLNAARLPQGQKLALDMFPDHGTPERSYIGPDSLAQVLCSLLAKRDSLPEHLNIAAPRAVSMRALAEAAAVPFALRPTPPAAHQHITLDCSALSALHRFGARCSEPAEMVRQWVGRG